MAPSINIKLLIVLYVVLIMAVFPAISPAYGATDGEGKLAPGGVEGVVRQKDPKTQNIVPVNEIGRASCRERVF